MADGITDSYQPEVRVKFGDRPHQTLPAQQAGEVLTLLRSRNPKVFGDALLEVLAGAEAVRGRAGSNGNGRA